MKSRVIRSIAGPIILLAGLGSLLAVVGVAQTAAPTPQFDMIGHIQAATLDTSFTVCTPPTDPASNGADNTYISIPGTPRSR